ncbi:MAG: hypothetical protein Q4F57_09390 [Weeksellaceae bacterium]|nr:hypothetical protein [Weeksellaceae bacterium]
MVNRKFFSIKAITLATFVGGPLATAYMVKKNYEAMLQPEKARNSLIIGVGATTLIIIFLFLTPEHIIDKIPNIVLPILYAMAAYFLVEEIQGANIKVHEENGGEFYSNWHAVGVAVIATLIFAAALAISVFAFDGLSSNQVHQEFESTPAYEMKIAEFVENENEVLAVFDDM